MEGPRLVIMRTALGNPRPERLPVVMTAVTCGEELHLCSGRDATSCSLSTISRFSDEEGTSFATSKLRTLTCSGNICGTLLLVHLPEIKFVSPLAWRRDFLVK